MHRQDPAWQDQQLVIVNSVKYESQWVILVSEPEGRWTNSSDSDA